MPTNEPRTEDSPAVLQTASRQATLDGAVDAQLDDYGDDTDDDADSNDHEEASDE